LKLSADLAAAASSPVARRRSSPAGARRGDALVPQVAALERSSPTAAPRDPLDDRDASSRSGRARCDEAALFAAELLRM